MAKKRASSSEGVYRVIDVIGTSKVSWEDAAAKAVATASKSLRDLRIAEVSKLDMGYSSSPDARAASATAATRPW